MDDIDILKTLAEVAATLLGFTGVVVVLNPEREWHVQEEGRLRNLLESASIVLLFAVLPFVLLAFGIGEALLWRLGNGALGMIGLLIAGLVIQRYRDIVRSEDEDLAGPWAFAVLCGGSVLIAGVQVADALAEFSNHAWPLYLTALVWLILLSLLNFMALLILRRR